MNHGLFLLFPWTRSRDKRRPVYRLYHDNVTDMSEIRHNNHSVTDSKAHIRCKSLQSPCHWHPKPTSDASPYSHSVTDSKAHIRCKFLQSLCHWHPKPTSDASPYSQPVNDIQSPHQIQVPSHRVTNSKAHIRCKFLQSPCHWHPTPTSDASPYSRRKPDQDEDNQKFHRITSHTDYTSMAFFPTSSKGKQLRVRASLSVQG